MDSFFTLRRASGVFIELMPLWRAFSSGQIKIENLYLLCADLKKIRATHFLQGELALPSSKK